jgi:poly(3-hydroxybutyrate) depolymerase
MNVAAHPHPQGTRELLYYLYEMNHAAIAPWRAAADAAKLFWKNPINPIAQTYMGRSVAASLDLFERVTRRYGKPTFGISEVIVDGVEASIVEERILHKTFCTLLHFSKRWPEAAKPVKQPKLLIVAPMSGH